MKDGFPDTFRGFFMPREILEWVADGKLNLTEASVLCLVKGLCENSGKGCWASNRYLSRVVGVRPDYVSKVIQNLKRLGFVTLILIKEKRTILMGDCAELSRLDPSGESLTPLVENHYPRSLSKERELDRVIDIGSLGESKSMAVFRQSSKQTKSTPFDLDMADKLHTLIVQVRKIFRQWNRSKWADTFRLLREEMDNGEARIKRVFDWYSVNAKAKNVPSISNAIDFRKRFDWLEDLADKSVGPYYPVGEEALAIAKRVYMKGWPGNIKEKVPVTIQVSLDRFKVLLLEYKEVVDNTLQAGAYTIFLKHLKTRLGAPENFVEQWMYMLHEKYARWKEWNGDLVGQAFHESHPLFHKMGKRWATAFGGDVQLWDQFIKDLATVKE